MTLPAREISLVVAALLAITGCAEDQAPSRDTGKPLPDVPSLAAGWTNWPAVTPPNYKVSERLAMLCNEPPTTEVGTAGPHQEVPIRVHVNSAALPAMQQQRFPRVFPVGSVIVKAKYVTNFFEPPDLGIMIKREAGFDPAGGDWEYAYLSGTSHPQVTRGVLANCKECHSRQAAGDFVFGSYALGGREEPGTPYP
jgi:hypothetical protein